MVGVEDGLIPAGHWLGVEDLRERIHCPSLLVYEGLLERQAPGCATLVEFPWHWFRLFETLVDEGRSYTMRRW